MDSRDNFYTVVFTITDRQKFMNNIGGQILELARNDKAEEVGASVSMVAFNDYRKHADYAEFISNKIDDSFSDLPTFEDWVKNAND